MAQEMVILRLLGPPNGSDKIGVKDSIYGPYLRLNKTSVVVCVRERVTHYINLI